MDMKLRKLGAGDWYWINKEVIRHCVGKVGFSAMTVYNFLASMTDNNQRCFPSQSYIAEHLGCSRATVNRAIKKLAKQEIIFVQKEHTHRSVYYLLEVKCNKDVTAMLHGRNRSVQKEDTNKNNKQDLNNNPIVRDQKNASNILPDKTRAEILASDIADALDDHKNRTYYLSLVFRYPEPFLRKILSELKRTPKQKIRKSQKALFLYLINYYARKNH